MHYACVERFTEKWIHNFKMKVIKNETTSYQMQHFIDRFFFSIFPT